MPAWYQRAAWGFLRRVRGPRLLDRFNVSAEFLQEEPREPYVLLANHAHALDPWILGSLLRATIRFMANLEGVHPAKALFADVVGAYGRRKGAPDIAALSRTVKLARAGETLGIFPEGDRSWDGLPQELRPGLGKLLRMLGMPALLARQEGSYLSGPRWARRPRRGRWNVSFHVLSRDRIMDSRPEDLESEVRAALAVDDLREPRLRRLDFECSAPALGVERLLWLCPVCGESDVLGSEPGRVSCSACGSSWKLDGNQRLTPEGGRSGTVPFADLRDWTWFQKRELLRRVDRSDALGISGAGTENRIAEPLRGRRFPKRGSLVSALVSRDVELGRRTRRGMERWGVGNLSLYRDAMVFTPEGECRHVFFEARNVLYFVDNFNVYSEFSYGAERFRLFFRGGNSMKWIDGLAALRNGKGESA